jgi:hypothetical protein
MSKASPLVSVYDGRQLVGWIIARGKLGYESFDAREQSLGTFSTQAAAIDECIKQKAPAG